MLYRDCKKLLVLIAGWSIISFALGQARTEPKIAQPSDKNLIKTRSVLMIIAPKDFRDEEFKVPYDLLESLGYKVAIASLDTVKATGILG